MRNILAHTPINQEENFDKKKFATNADMVSLFLKYKPKIHFTILLILYWASHGMLGEAFHTTVVHPVQMMKSLPKRPVMTLFRSIFSQIVVPVVIGCAELIATT